MATPAITSTATARDLEVIARHIDDVETAARAVLRAWDDLNNPEIRVGPVRPRMADLREAIGMTTPEHMKENRAKHALPNPTVRLRSGLHVA